MPLDYRTVQGQQVGYDPGLLEVAFENSGDRIHN